MSKDLKIVLSVSDIGDLLQGVTIDWPYALMNRHDLEGVTICFDRGVEDSNWMIENRSEEKETVEPLIKAQYRGTNSSGIKGLVQGQVYDIKIQKDPYYIYVYFEHGSCAYRTFNELWENWRYPMDQKGVSND